ncbi:MAG: hypothetical protein RMM29_02590 [Planctomycetota bacterium]|nr:hypothetical protein [Planctomycetota bacterium]MCX8040183.1 hypothetical protein [Planctomycetota bacterium]MDW8372522.1 hypothetical protein [Planctomycetota bacterium]
MTRLAPLGAALALAAAGAALAWLALGVPPLPPPPVPGHPGGELEAIVAEVQPLGAFESFYVNDDNPFVPWRERAVERQRLQPAPIATPPPRPPPRIVPIQPPKLELPRLPPPGAGDAPRVLGYTRLPDGSLRLLAQLPDEPPRLLAVGEQLGRWRFLELDAGNVAVFSDELGRQHRFPIGR